VAIKILGERHRGDRDTRARFLREAHAVASIGHRNIVKMLEAGIRAEDGVPYLVMEFLFGEPLGRTLAREGAAPVAMLVPALQQAAAALQAAHDKGVIHRDLKPDNLFLVGEPGDPWELKVLDFGVSRLVNRSHTAVGMLLGTPAYMAPEQVLGEPTDARTDVYALGMVLYHALTGVLPFAGCDDTLVLAHQLHSTPLPPKELGDFDPRFDALVLRAVAKDPARRYPDMTSFAGALRQLADPSAALDFEPDPADAYAPQTEMGRLLAASLGRNLGARGSG
jgi:serine/threonine-protein kinase